MSTRGGNDHEPAPCAGCGKVTPWHGGVFTREGAKPVCSHDCFLKASKRDDACTIGELEDARRAGLN